MDIKELIKDSRCFIFDLDGTLTDSFSAWKRVDLVFMQRRGLPIPKDYFEKMASMTFSEAAEYVRAECGVTDPKDRIIGEWLSLVELEYRHRLELLPGALELLKGLKDKGCGVVLATSCDKRLYLPFLKRNGVLELFDAIVDSGMVSRGKGFPDIYLMSARLAGFKPEDCVVFEDVPLACRGARSAGMLTIGVLGGLSKNEEELRESCDGVISGFLELL